MKWSQTAVGGLYFERMIGFSLPVQHQVAIIAYEGIYIIDIDAMAQAEKDSSYPEGGDLYDRRGQKLQYGGITFPILGVFGGDPIIQNMYGELLQLDKEREVLRVEVIGQAEALEFPYEDMSGDWAYATFSEDGQLILLGMPYDLLLFHRG